MPTITKKPPAMWNLASQEVQTACKRWRLKLNRNYEWIRIREVAEGQTVRTFALTGLRWTDATDIRRARDLCLQAEAQGFWPEDSEQAAQTGWTALAKRVAEDIKIRIPKKGSHGRLVSVLESDIAKLDGPLAADTLERWIGQWDALNDYYPYLSRLDLISQINKSAPELELDALLLKLRSRRRQRIGGSAGQLIKASKRRVRVLPTNDEIEDWLLSMTQLYEGFPFNQYFFALLSTYGLRPHEIWHAQCIDERGWLVIPGGSSPDENGRALQTKTRTHVAPPSPAEWVDLFALREGFARFQELLHERYPVQWKAASTKRAGVNRNGDVAWIPVNNSDLGAYAAKLTRRGMAPTLYVKQLPTPQQKQPTELREVCNYDLRHAYAVRLLSDPLYARVPLEQHSAWMGHGLGVHVDVYHRWIGNQQLLASRQKIVDECNRTHLQLPPQIMAVLTEAVTTESALDESRQLAELREQLAAAQRELESRNALFQQLQAMMAPVAV